MLKAKIIIISILFSYAAMAQTSGALDTSFNHTGYVYTGLSAGPTGRGCVAIQTDGKIIIAGRTYTTYWHFAMTRYNTDGTKDLTFGTNGVTTVGIAGSDDEANCIALQSDGKIVLAGLASNGTNYDFALARFKTNGTLDSTFGANGNGRVYTAIGTSQDIANAIAIQPDGKIVLAGSASNGTNLDAAVARYKTNGTLDSTFGTNGKVITSMGATDDLAYGVVVQPNGKIVIAGYQAAIAGTANFTLARYSALGVLDNSFGTAGIKIVPLGGTLNIALAVTLQTDNKIVACGYNDLGSNREFAVLRFDTTGALDNSFNGSGKVFTDIGSANDEAYAVMVQTDGKIVAAGYADDGTHKHFALTRYSSAGVLDNTFGASGIVNTPFLTTTDDYGSTAALQTDGKIVVGGRSALSGNYQYVVARYYGTATAVVGTPVFNAGTSSTRCPGAGSVTYTATATNSTGITYSLDANSINAGNSINASTGQVTFVAGFSGTSIITATATGPGGPTTSTHTVTTSATVGTVTFTAGPTSLCAGQSATYTATSAGATTVRYSIQSGGAVIDSVSGAASSITGSFVVKATATNACGSSANATWSVTVTPNVATPTFLLGATSNRCQASAIVTYTANAVNNSGITYTLDAPSLNAGNTINAATGAVTYAAGYTGTSTITATATGCGGPTTATHMATTSVALGSASFTAGATSLCSGQSDTYTASAANATTVRYQIISGGAVVDSITGTVSSVTGSFTVQATVSNGCGSTTITRAVTVTLAVGTPVFTLGSTSNRCQQAGSVSYSATAANNTGITYTLDAASLNAGNSINAATGAVTYAAGYTGTSTITATATGCGGPTTATHMATTSVALGTASFTAGATTLCTGQTDTYTATASNATSVRYHIIAGGATIDSITGVVSAVTGSFTVQATVSNGCGSTTVSRSVTVTPAVGTPAFTLGTTSIRCQEIGDVTYTATASNSTSIGYSLDATSLGAGNTINASTGEVVYTAGYNGNAIITATAIGCGGPVTATHTVTISQSVAPSILISASPNDTVCGGVPVTLTVNITGGGSSPVYEWRKNNVVVGTSATYTDSVPANGDAITCQLTSSLSCASPNTAMSNLITLFVHAAPTAPTITQSGNMLLSSPATTYQWYHAGNALTGEINQVYTMSVSGDYTVVVTDANGCSATSSLFNATYTGINEIANNISFEIYPNPATDVVQIKLNRELVGKTLELFDINGASLNKTIITSEQSTMDISKLAAGVYFVKVEGLVKKLVKGK